MGPALALLIIAALSLIVIRVGTIALTRTGLSRDTAGFQALSAFFGVGFTTSEAEMVVSHPVRRRIIRDLILIGHLGVLSAVGLMVAAFIPGGEASPKWTIPMWAWKLMLLVTGLGVLFLITSLSVVQRLIDRSIQFTLERSGVVRAMDYDLLLRVTHGFAISEVEIESHNDLAGRTLAETRFRQQGVIVLGIARSDGQYVGAPNGATRIEPGDSITVYGRETDILEAMHLKATLPPDHRELQDLDSSGTGGGKISPS